MKQWLSLHIRSPPSATQIRCTTQKIFTDTETANLTGICLEHLHGLARKRHLGFIARAAEVAGMQPDQWLFTLSDLMVLLMLHPRCEH